MTLQLTQGSFTYQQVRTETTPVKDNSEHCYIPFHIRANGNVFASVFYDSRVNTLPQAEGTAKVFVNSVNLLKAAQKVIEMIQPRMDLTGSQTDALDNLQKQILASTL